MVWCMKVRQVNYNGSILDIEDVTVTLSFKEAVALVNLSGKFNGRANTKLDLVGDDSLYEALTDMFNRHYDDGAPDLHIDIKTLNEG